MAISRYGVTWPEGFNDLHVELIAFRDGTKRWGGDDDNRPYHFKQVVKFFWGPKSKHPVQWNPWADRMLEAACNHQYFMLCGSASSGKSFFLALWGVVNWLCDPENTLVFFTSTSLEGARTRIWGDVEKLIQSTKTEKGESVLPAKLLSSTGKVRTYEGGRQWPDKCGLQLVAGDRAKEKENIGKLIGAKNKRVFLLADELPELSPALIEAAKSNLMVNPYFQMAGSGNFKGLYDPFGIMCEPALGWNSVTPEFEEWLTKDGICLRFDGPKSPNVLAGGNKYEGIYSIEKYHNHVRLGVNTAAYWRMCRSFPCPEADVNRIYSDADLLKGDVKSTKVFWADDPVDVAFLDPAFATGGDKAMAVFGKKGMSTERKQVLLVTEFKELKEDIRKKEESKSVQVAKKFRDECTARKILPKNAGYDGSGGGVVFGGLLAEIWKDEQGQSLGMKTLSVLFGGAASERPASVKDRRPSKEAFMNRVGEIWYAGIDFIHSGQIKGLNDDCCIELTERRNHKEGHEKGLTGLKIKIESKVEMKNRTSGKSPDSADGFLGLLELCRERLGFVAVGMEGQRPVAKLENKRRLMLVNRIYQNNTHEHNYADTEETVSEYA